MEKGFWAWPMLHCGQLAQLGPTRPTRAIPPRARAWPRHRPRHQCRPPRPGFRPCRGLLLSLTILPPHVCPDSAAAFAVTPGFPLPIKHVRGRGKFPPPFRFIIPHRSAPTLPPLCAGKPSSTCSQVECSSHRRPEPQPQAKLTPARSCQGRLTPSSSLQVATGVVFHRPSPGPDHPSTSITESWSPSMTTSSPTSGVSPAAHQCTPSTRDTTSRTALYMWATPLQPLKLPLHLTGILLGCFPHYLAALAHSNPATTSAIGHRSPVSNLGRPVSAWMNSTFGYFPSN
jgi:hypothetical protein